MAVWTIAELTLKEAVRRRTLVGAFLLGLLTLGLSLLLILIRHRMQTHVHNGVWSQARYDLEYPTAISVITSLCLFAIRILGSLFAILLAGGAISGEIERGLLAVMLPKPIPRWQILLGKWIGLNLVMVGSVLVWTAMVWTSLSLQTRQFRPDLLMTGPLLALFPVVIGTLTLSLSTFAQRLLGTSLALFLAAFSWLDGVFNALHVRFDVDFLRTLADIAGLLVPQGYIAWWVEGVAKDLLLKSPFGESPARSSRFLQQWGETHLHFAHLDALYLVGYVIGAFVIGAVVFQKRDV